MPCDVKMVVVDLKELPNESEEQDQETVILKFKVVSWASVEGGEDLEYEQCSDIALAANQYGPTTGVRD